MGLTLNVGVLSSERSADFARRLEGLNEVLRSAGLPEHEEPRPARFWNYSLPSYGLQALRRVAAYVQLEKALPRTEGDEDADSDPVLSRYFASKTQDAPAVGFRKKSGHDRRFDHLIFHSDCEGFYLPRDFESVLTSDDLEGLELGSVPRLQKELESLRKELRIPEGVTDPETQHDAPSFTTERYCCVALLNACRIAQETGCALVFS